MFFPPSTNAQYRGAPVAAHGLVLAGILELIPGLIHYFLPDGGAGVIAGLDMGTRRQTIVALFAWFGSVQIPFALLLIVIGLRYRPLVPLGLLAFILARLLMAIDGWLGKGSVSGHHPPEHYASPAAVMIGLGLLVLAARPRQGAA